jgi:hypothetical protein
MAQPLRAPVDEAAWRDALGQAITHLPERQRQLVRLLTREPTLSYARRDRVRPRHARGKHRADATALPGPPAAGRPDRRPGGGDGLMPVAIGFTPRWSGITGTRSLDFREAGRARATAGSCRSQSRRRTV